MRFELGRIVATPGAIDKVKPERLTACLRRHAHADWGELDASDKAANDRALGDGSRIMSAYPIEDGKPETFWIVTEADRSVTTFLLPEEY